MNFQLVFQGSGDSIDFVSVYPELTEHIIDLFSGLPNFEINKSNLVQQVYSKCVGLQKEINDTNVWFEYLTGKEFPYYEDPLDYLDQNTLNYIHAFWVNSQNWIYNIDQQRVQKNYQGLVEQIHDLYPDDIREVHLFSLITEKLGYTDYLKINWLYVHGIESAFDCITASATSNGWVEWPNLFGQYVTDDVCNLSLSFNHLGRTLSNKFKNFDENLEHDDENTFKEILPFVEFNLAKPQTNSYSLEYQQWCHKHNRVPSGNLMPLGNIPNLYDNLKKYRIMITKNLLSNNGFKFIKG